MATLEICVPQMGEGLQEVIIQQFLKKPGDKVKRDELIYNMETDKATMEVESAYEGVLQEWLCEEGAVIAIGAPIARFQVEETASVAQAGSLSPTPAVNPASSDSPSLTDDSSAGDLIIPPRTRAYCRENQISDEEMRHIRAVTGKLLPSDVDAYLAAKCSKSSSNGSAENLKTLPTLATAPRYEETALTQQQRTFIYRIKRSAQIVVPATAKRSIEWNGLKALAEKIRSQGGELQPSTFQIFAFCVAQAIREHPKFRSALIGETTLRQYDHVNLGIAVGTLQGELSIAVVPEADTLDFPTFVSNAQKNIKIAREGEDQATDTTQFLLTYMGAYELTDAIPVLVAPAVGVLFIGSTYEQGGQTLANLALTFDHRLVQGIESAEFLKTVVAKARDAENLISELKGRG